MSYSTKHSSTFCNEVKKINNKARKSLRGKWHKGSCRFSSFPQRLRGEEERIEGRGGREGTEEKGVSGGRWGAECRGASWLMIWMSLFVEAWKNRNTKHKIKMRQINLNSDSSYSLSPIFYISSIEEHRNLNGQTIWEVGRVVVQRHCSLVAPSRATKLL